MEGLNEESITVGTDEYVVVNIGLGGTTSRDNSLGQSKIEAQHVQTQNGVQ